MTDTSSSSTLATKALNIVLNHWLIPHHDLIHSFDQIVDRSVSNESIAVTIASDEVTNSEGWDIDLTKIQELQQEFVSLPFDSVLQRCEEVEEGIYTTDSLIKVIKSLLIQYALPILQPLYHKTMCVATHLQTECNKLRQLCIDRIKDQEKRYSHITSLIVYQLISFPNWDTQLTILEHSIICILNCSHKFRKFYDHILEAIDNSCKEEGHEENLYIAQIECILSQFVLQPIGSLLDELPWNWQLGIVIDTFHATIDKFKMRMMLTDHDSKVLNEYGEEESISFVNQHLPYLKSVIDLRQIANNALEIIKADETESNPISYPMDSVNVFAYIFNECLLVDIQHLLPSDPNNQYLLAVRAVYGVLRCELGSENAATDSEIASLFAKGKQAAYRAMIIASRSMTSNEDTCWQDKLLNFVQASYGSSMTKLAYGAVQYANVKDFIKCDRYEPHVIPHLEMFSTVSNQLSTLCCQLKRLWINEIILMLKRNPFILEDDVYSSIFQGESVPHQVSSETYPLRILHWIIARIDTLIDGGILPSIWLTEDDIIYNRGCSALMESAPFAEELQTIWDTAQATVNASQEANHIQVLSSLIEAKYHHDDFKIPEYENSNEIDPFKQKLMKIKQQLQSCKNMFETFSPMNDTQGVFYQMVTFNFEFDAIFERLKLYILSKDIDRSNIELNENSNILFIETYLSWLEIVISFYSIDIGIHQTLSNTSLFQNILPLESDNESLVEYMGEQQWIGEKGLDILNLHSLWLSAFRDPIYEDDDNEDEKKEKEIEYLKKVFEWFNEPCEVNLAEINCEDAIVTVQEVRSRWQLEFARMLQKRVRSTE